MMLDAITVFLRRILNQKHAINKYAKMGSDGVFGREGEKKKRRSASNVFLPRRTLLVRKEFLKVRGKSKPFLAFPGHKTA